MGKEQASLIRAPIFFIAYENTSTRKVSGFLWLPVCCIAPVIHPKPAAQRPPRLLRRRRAPESHLVLQHLPSWLCPYRPSSWGEQYLLMPIF